MITAFYENIIYGKTAKTAKKYLKNLLPQIQYIDKRENKHEMFVEASNGEYFKTVVATENAYTYRYNIAYVDKNINPELIENVIKKSGKSKDSQIIYY